MRAKMNRLVTGSHAVIIIMIAMSCPAEAARPRRPSGAQIKQMQERREETSTLGRDRTCDLWFRKPSLYPLSYEGE